MLRRRASVAARMALKAAFDSLPGGEKLPTVFCSRHGEVGRSVELMEMMARGEGHLPMSFSLSVHNAAAGLYGIARNDTSNSVTLAAGKNTLPMAIFEACALMQQGEEKVLVVDFDDVVPRPFAQFRDETDPAFALALLLGPGKMFSLKASESAPQEEPKIAQCQAPHVAKFFASQKARLDLGHWVWQRHS